MNPNDGRVVSNFIVQALRGESITIYGDGTQTRSFQYVDDLIEAMIRMMATEDDFTGPVNTGNPDEFTMLELAERIIRLTGSKSEIVFNPPAKRRPEATKTGHLPRAPAARRLEPFRRTRTGPAKDDRVFQAEAR